MNALVQAVNSILNGKMQSGTTDDIFYADGNVVWQHKGAATSQVGQTILPFTIYNVASNNGVAIDVNGTGYAAGDSYSVAGGTVAPGGQPTIVTIGLTGNNGAIYDCSAVAGSYTVPPTYPANLTAISGIGTGATVTITSAADSWRTFQMRDGLIRWRPAFPQFHSSTGLLPVNGPLDFRGFSSFSGSQPSGCYEWTLGCIGDGESGTLVPNPQPTPALGAGIVLQDLTDVQIGGYDAGGYFVNFTQILMSNSVIGDPGTYPPNISIWAEVIDDPVKGFYANLWARMWGGGSGFGTQGPPFPVGQNIIPIGMARTGLSDASGSWVPLNNPSYNQIQVGNVANRVTTSGGGLARCERGFWKNTDGSANLGGQLFYNGDVVIDNSTNTSGTQLTLTEFTSGSDTILVAYWGIWQYNNPAATGFDIVPDADPPSSGAGPWVQIGTFVQTFLT